MGAASAVAAAAAAVPQKVVMDAYEVSTIINNLNALYSGAMSQVITYTAVIIALVGIGIPFLAALNQKRNFKAESESLEKNIHESIDNAKVIIRNDLIAEMKESISSEEAALNTRIEEKFRALDKKLECAKAATFYLQGAASFRLKHFASAAIDFSTSTISDMKGGDERNAQRALKTIVQQCLPNINKTDFDEFPIEKSINEVITYLGEKEVNINDRYTDIIEKLGKELKTAQMREKPAE